MGLAQTHAILTSILTNKVQGKPHLVHFHSPIVPVNVLLSNAVSNQQILVIFI